MADLEVARAESNARLFIREDLVASIVPEVRQEIKRLIAEGVTDLVVDLDAVRIVDSAGIGSLVAAYNSLVQKNGCLSVENVSSDLLDLFTSMRLDRHFSITRSA
jgi:anti-anti-sigma factor